MRRPLPGQGLSYGREPCAQRWKWGHQRFRSNHTLHIRTFRGSRGLWRTCQPTLLAPLPETPPEPQGPWDSPGQSWKGLEGHPAPPLQLPEVQLPEVQLPEELGPRAPGSWWEGPAERQQWEGIGKWGSEMLKTAVTGLWWIRGSEEAWRRRCLPRGQTLDPRDWGGVGVESVPLGHSPGESRRARASRGCGLGKGFRQPDPSETLPSLGSPPAAPTALCLLQQLPARGGAHAGARPRRGGLLPAVRVQVRGAQHHHHQGARRPPRPAPARPRPTPSSWGACVAPPRPPSCPVCFCSVARGWGAGSRLAWSQPRDLLPTPLGAALPSDAITLAGVPGRGAETPSPTLPVFLSLLAFRLFSRHFRGSCCVPGTVRDDGAEVARPPEPAV